MSLYEHNDRATWRLGIVGGLRRAKDVLRNRRGAPDQTNVDGPADRTGGFSDLSPLPRHFSVPSVGANQPGPGLRPCGRGDDPDTKVGGKNQMNVHEATWFYREACITTYRQHGRLSPGLWCEGEEWYALMDPVTWDGLSVTDWEITQMLLSALLAVNGTIVGRNDEMLFRFGKDTMRQSKFVDLVDVDPSIRTGLFVHALDVRTTVETMKMATVDLDGDGEPYWIRQDGDCSVDLMIPLWGVGRLFSERRKSGRPSFEEVEQICHDNDWIVDFRDK